MMAASKTSVIINILDYVDNRFSGQPVPDRVLPRPAFAVFGCRTGTSERVAPIGFDLSERGHGLVGRSVRMETTFTKPPPRSGIVSTDCGSGRFGAVADMSSASPLTATGAPLDRACCQSLRANGWSNFLFGTGYYTHRYVLPDTLRETSSEYGYDFPERYRTVVRTAVFNGMLVDTGLVGILLFASLFVLTGLTVMRSGGVMRLFKPGPALTALASLALIAISLNVGATYDVVALYLAVMPYGSILLLFNPPTA
jgi:hypothetical protein